MADAPTPQPTTTAGIQAAAQPGNAVVPPNIGNPNAPTTPAPDLSNMSGPTGTPEQAIYEGNMQGATDQRQQAATAANTPLAPPKHAVLLQMIQGLSAAVAGSGAQWASRGKVNGAEVTNQILAQEAQQRENQQKLAMEQKQQDVQNHLAIGASNEATANMMANLMSLKQEMSARDLQMKGEKISQIGATQDVRTKALQDYMQTGDLKAYQDTLSQIGNVTAPAGGASAGGAAPAAPVVPATGAATGGASSATPAATGAALPPVAIGSWQNGLDAASLAYPNDPDIKQAAADFKTAQGQAATDPQAASLAMARAARIAQNRMSALDTGVKSQTAQEAAATNAPLGDRATALNAAMLQRYQVSNPGAKALPAGYALSANSTPADFNRVDKIMQQTETAYATQAQRETANAMRAQTLALSGLGAPGGDVKLSGDAYVASLPPAEAALVKEVGTGKVAPTRMDYILSRNPKLTAEVALAYPDWDASKASAYPALYKDYTSGKTSVQLNSGATAAKHLAELKAINDAHPLEARTLGTAAYGAFNNKLNTVSGELVKFYGMPDTDQSIEAMTKTLGGLGNRTAAIQEQVKSMSDKMQSLGQTWKNGAPSAAYEAPLPGIDADAVKAMVSMDPNFAEKNPDLAKLAGGGASARPAGVSGQAILMQVPGGQPHWIEPKNVSAATAAGATEVK